MVVACAAGEAGLGLCVPFFRRESHSFRLNITSNSNLKG
jgi:hypothetical protein